MHNAESARITDSAKRWHGYEQIVQIWATVSLYVLHVDIVQIGGDVHQAAGSADTGCYGHFRGGPVAPQIVSVARSSPHPRRRGLHESRGGPVPPPWGSSGPSASGDRS
jgi:hypothetical protein